LTFPASRGGSAAADTNKPPARFSLPLLLPQHNASSTQSNWNYIIHNAQSARHKHF
jgi:hypothetical protein